MKAAEYLVRSLIAEGIKHCFFVPGGTLDPILFAAEKISDIKLILAGHECSGVYMADGYAKASGNFGVAMGIAGPGITNMVTGIAQAYTDGTPLFIISGAIKTSVEGRGAFQDSSPNGIHDVAILEPVTTKQSVMSNVNLVKPHIQKLFHNMLGHATRGPVQLSFPVDVQSAEMGDPTYQPLPKTLRQPRFLDETSAKAVWPRLKEAVKVAVLIGEGGVYSDAQAELVAFAERYEIPILTTIAAKGVMPEDHRLSMGVFGWYGNRYATELLIDHKPEVLIVIGSRLTQFTSLTWSKEIRPTKALLVNDINESGISADYQPDEFVLGDARQFLHYLNHAEEGSFLLSTREKRKQWLDSWMPKSSRYYDEEYFLTDKTPISPARVAFHLRNIFPKETIFFSGEGDGSFTISHYWKSYKPRQYFTPVRTFSPMGWSIGAAIGGKLARPDVPVVAITGDGTMLMHGTEIQTAAHYNIPVVFIVINNGALGPLLLRAERIPNYKADFLKLPVYDWAKFAEVFGVAGISVKKPEEIAPALEKALKLNKPVVVDIHCFNYQTPTYAYDYFTSGTPWPNS